MIPLSASWRRPADSRRRFVAAGFRLPPERGPALHGAVVRVRFQMVFGAWATKEMSNLRFVIHGVVTSGKALAARAFWTGDAEAPASSVASASSYSAAEDVRILAIVETKLKFGEIQRQIFLADVVVCADDSTLQKTPKVIDIRGMNLAAHILARAVANELVRIIGSQIHVTVGFIGRDQINSVADGLAHESVQRAFIGALDHPANHVTLAADCADDWSLACGATSDIRALVGVFVLFFSAHERLVYFDDAHQLLKFGIVHRGAQAMAHEPSGAVRAASDHPMDLQGTDALLGSEHQVQNLEPDQQFVIRILENRAADERETVVFAGLAEPVEGPRVQLIDGGIAATRTLHAIRPAMFHQVSLAGQFIWKEGVKSRKCHLANKLWFVFLPRHVHEKRIAQMDPRVKSGTIAISDVVRTRVFLVRIDD